MDMVDLEIGTGSNNECNICYETCCAKKINVLSCCNNTKSICQKCLGFLSTPICPYCRNKLDEKCMPYLKTNITIPHSYPQDGYNSLNTFLQPYSFESFLEEERIIDPLLFDDSRRLRRQMRRLRHEYNQRRTEREQSNISIAINNSGRSSSRQNNNQSHRNRRQYLNQESRRMTQLYNDISNVDDYSDMDQELMFHIDDEF